MADNGGPAEEDDAEVSKIKVSHVRVYEPYDAGTTAHASRKDEFDLTDVVELTGANNEENNGEELGIVPMLQFESKREVEWRHRPPRVFGPLGEGEDDNNYRNPNIVGIYGRYEKDAMIRKETYAPDKQYDSAGDEHIRIRGVHSHCLLSWVPGKKAHTKAHGSHTSSTQKNSLNVSKIANNTTGGFDPKQRGTKRKQRNPEDNATICEFADGNDMRQKKANPISFKVMIANQLQRSRWIRPGPRAKFYSTVMPPVFHRKTLVESLSPSKQLFALRVRQVMDIPVGGRASRENKRLKEDTAIALQTELNAVPEYIRAILECAKAKINPKSYNVEESHVNSLNEWVVAQCKRYKLLPRFQVGVLDKVDDAKGWWRTSTNYAAATQFGNLKRKKADLISVSLYEAESKKRVADLKGNIKYFPKIQKLEGQSRARPNNRDRTRTTFYGFG